MSLSSHVLDTTRGRPASGVVAVLESLSEAGWSELERWITDADGRARAKSPIPPGVYRITFDTAAYFADQGVTGFYPCVPVVFEVTDGSQHHHVPLLVSPYGYSTYRGS